MKDAPWWATLALAALSVVGTWLAKPDASAGRADSQDSAVSVLLEATKHADANEKAIRVLLDALRECERGGDCR